MARPKSAVAKATEAILEDARQTDLRRQAQIANQTAIINRLMEGGTYDDVLARLNEQLAETQVRLVEAEAEIASLRAEQAEG